MKHITFRLSALTVMTTLLLMSCTTKSPSVETGLAQEASKLVILIKDSSLSLRDYCAVDSGHVETLYTSIANEGGVVYALQVLSNSTLQEPLKSLVVKPLPERELIGNPYQNANIKKENEGIRVQQKQQRIEFFHSLEPIVGWNSSQSFSDIQGALQIAIGLCNNPTYAAFDKQVILISDCMHDLPPKHGSDKWKKVVLPHDVELILVRPDNRLQLTDIFEGNVITFQNIMDALEHI